MFSVHQLFIPGMSETISAQNIAPVKYRTIDKKKKVLLCQNFELFPQTFAPLQLNIRAKDFNWDGG
jgi:hypothetical protein